jgi:uncharacterized protein YeaO (DUF488 family)
MIKLRRVYEALGEDDGFRVLVERLWPRGITKERAHIDAWMKDIAPSADLRKWYGHDTARWEEFRRRYREELKEQENLVRTLGDKLKAGTVTLVFAARDTEHSSAFVLKGYLEACEKVKTERK